MNVMVNDSFFVMAGLVPAIHVFLCIAAAKTWMPGTSPGMTSFNQSVG
jgi:hypothetical protein